MLLTILRGMWWFICISVAMTYTGLTFIRLILHGSNWLIDRMVGPRGS